MTDSKGTPLLLAYLKAPSHTLALNISHWILSNTGACASDMLLSYTFLFIRDLSVVSEGQEKILNFFLTL